MCKECETCFDNIAVFSFGNAILLMSMWTRYSMKVLAFGRSCVAL